MGETSYLEVGFVEMPKYIITKPTVPEILASVLGLQFFPAPPDLAASYQNELWSYGWAGDNGRLTYKRVVTIYFPYEEEVEELEQLLKKHDHIEGHLEVVYSKIS